MIDNIRRFLTPKEYHDFYREMDDRFRHMPITLQLESTANQFVNNYFKSYCPNLFNYYSCEVRIDEYGVFQMCFLEKDRLVKHIKMEIEV
jgi:hypothetical protein